MALGKDIDTQYGAKATYWNIAMVQNNTKDRIFVARLFGYIDKEARLEKAQPIATAEFRLEGDTYRQEVTLSEIYTELKLSGDFSGSLDV